MGRDPQVQEHPVNFPNFQVGQDVTDIRKIALDQNFSPAKGMQALFGCGDGIVIPVDADQQAVGSGTLQNRPCMAAAPQGPVHVDAAACAPQRLNNLLEHDRLVKGTHAMDLP